ncbi:MAG: BBP7 family outer membrane beta-barrel protein [Mariniblastus sp.]|nr:BBP7 family outer membrane beta-barrel protein [Mariniblastus sp.]
MKRSKPKFSQLCLTFLSLFCLGTSCMAMQEVPPPDSNTQKTVPPVVTPVQAEPVRASNMLLPIQNTPTVLPSEQKTRNTVIEKKESPKRTTAVLRIVSKEDGKIIPKAKGIIRLIPQTPDKPKRSPLSPLLPLPVESSLKKAAHSDTSLMLQPLMDLPKTKPAAPLTVRRALDIPQHVLYPTEETPSKIVKRKPQKGISKESPRRVGRNEISPQRDIIILKSAAAKPEVVQAETVQPEVVQAETVQPEVVQVETVQPEIVQAETVQPEIVQAETVQPESAPAKIDTDPIVAEAAEKMVMSPAVRTAKLTAAPPKPVNQIQTDSAPSAVSAAGIPYYAPATQDNEPPKNAEFPRGKELDEVLSQQLPLKNSLNHQTASQNKLEGSALLTSSSSSGYAPPRPLQRQSQEVTEQSQSIVESDPSIAPAEVAPGTSDYFIDENAAFNNVVDGCGKPACVGCYGGNETAMAEQMGCCGSMLCARRYVMVDALYMARNNGGVAGSDFFSVDTDYNYGWRVTIGRRRDAAEGTEFSYWGSNNLKGFSQMTANPNDSLNANFLPGFPVSNESISAFSNVFDPVLSKVTQQTQSLKTNFQSAELSRTKWAWDVFKSFAGIRYLYLGDEYNLTSQSITTVPPTFVVLNNTGTFDLETSNNLLGAHIGSEYFYDVGYRLSFSLVSQAGGFVNFANTKTRLINNGINVLDNEQNKTSLAGTIDLGLQSHFQLTPKSRLRFGYNALWMWGVYTAEDNFPSVIRPTTGTNPDTNNNAVLLQGLNFGMEFYR